MTLQLTGVVVIAVLVVASCGVSYAYLRRKLLRVVSDQSVATAGELSALAASIKELEARVAEFSQPAALQNSSTQVIELEAAAAVSMDEPNPEDEEVTPEIMAVIEAAANAFLGKKIRILSAKLLQSPNKVVSPWSQQGRVFVQASHNLRSRS